jgi:hypothetical protein
VHILTYAILDDHFYVLVRVPRATKITDAELLRRYHVFLPKLTRSQAAHVRIVSEQLKYGGPLAVAWRKQQLARMGDVSLFMKSVKQRFAAWYNRAHKRRGHFWCDRFTSVLIEGRGSALALTAAYIDLHPVRAGIVDNPKDYPFCGYAEAAGGSKSARAGIMAVVGNENGGSWRDAHEAYRKLLFGTGTETGAGGRADAEAIAIAPEALKKVLAQKGTLPLASVLRCRGGYFSNGSVLGSKAFVTKHLAAYRRATGRRKRAPAHPLPPITDWGDVVSMRGLRKKAIG